MRVLFDLNVLIDVIQRREPFYTASAKLLTRLVQHEISGSFAAHALTTLHYIVSKHAGQARADQAVDWALAHLEIVPQDRSVFLRARSLDFTDFEDAATASAAEATGCDFIATRNVKDFDASPVPALTPEEILSTL